MVGHCRWSRGACVLAGAIQAACAVEHAVIYRLLLRRGRAWRLRERTKAWVLLGDMLACMLLMMLVRCGALPARKTCTAAATCWCSEGSAKLPGALSSFQELVILKLG